jgi:hypothetical protein
LTGAEDIQDSFAGLRGAEWLGRAQDIPQTLEFNVFLPVAYDGATYHSETYHYEDDGDTQGYLDGVYQWTKAEYVLSSDRVVFTVHKADGSHPKAHAARSYAIRLRGCVPPSSVTVNGQPVTAARFETIVDKVGKNTWHFDGRDVATVITLYERFPVDQDVVVTVELPAGQQASVRRGLVMLPGLIARARLAKPMLDNLYPYAYPVSGCGLCSPPLALLTCCCWLCRTITITLVMR